MQHRIRAAAIIVRDERILLVGHHDHERNEQWWVPPGGGMEKVDRNSLDCVHREVLEETGCQLATEPTLAFVREFHDVREGYHHLELFYSADITDGFLHQDGDPGDGPDYIELIGARWLTKSELKNLTVYPEIIKEERFWQLARAGFPSIEYLGCSSEH